MTSGTGITPPAGGRDEALAAEYVVGVLSQAERRQVAARIVTDPAFALLVAAWEERLSPLAGEVETVEPPPALWQGIEEQLFTAPAPETRPAGWWNSLAAWRTLALACLLLAAAGLFWPLLDGLRPMPPAPALTATLRSDDTPDRFVAVLEPGSRALVLTALSAVPAADRDFELWIIAGDSAPVSLGVVPGDVSTRLAVPGRLRDRLSAGNLLAVSVESKGGSTTGAPTGPVVAAGKITALPQ